MPAKYKCEETVCGEWAPARDHLGPDSNENEGFALSNAWHVFRQNQIDESYRKQSGGAVRVTRASDGKVIWEASWTQTRRR